MKLPNSEQADLSVGRAPRPPLSSTHFDEEDVRVGIGDFAGYDSDGRLWYVTNVPAELCGERDFGDSDLSEEPSEAWAQYAGESLGLEDSVHGYLSRTSQESPLRVTGDELYDMACDSLNTDPLYRVRVPENRGKAYLEKCD
jgi:hypothetical protein